ncbi:tetratricopeptide repeat protein [Nocardia sp. NPDC004722]
MRSFAQGVLTVLLLGTLLMGLAGLIAIVIGVGKLLTDPNSEPTCNGLPMGPGMECVRLGEKSGRSYEYAVAEQRASHRDGIRYLEIGGAILGGSAAVFVGSVGVAAVLEPKSSVPRSLLRRRRPRREPARFEPIQAAPTVFEQPPTESPAPHDGDGLAGIGRIYEERGDLAAAEKCYRHGAVLGETAAMDRLARLLHDRIAAQGRFAQWRNRALNDSAHLEAHMWLRKAADAGNAQAMAALGAMLDEQGDRVEAERWYRRAVEAGENSAMNNLGLLLYRRGDYTAASQWWLRAAAAGSAAAVQNLRKLPYGLPVTTSPIHTARSGSIPLGSYADLLALVMGDRVTADSLIEYERQLAPRAHRQELIQKAVDRLRHDRNR